MISRLAALAAASAAAFALAVLIFFSGAAHAATWGAETNLSATATDSETGLNHRPLAFDANGTLHVVWAEKSAPNANYRILAREFAAGAWSAPALVVDYLASDPGTNVGAKYPALAASADGGLDLFWYDYRIDGIDNIEIYTKRRAPGAPWDASRDADVRLTTTDHPETNGDNGYVPTPAAAPDGTLHVLWYDHRFDGSHAEIFSKTRPAGGAWDLAAGDGPDVRVTTDGDHSELAACAVDAAGNVHAAWRSAGSGARVLYARRDAALETWSAATDVDLAGAVVGAPALAIDAAGRAHVVWPDSRDGGRALYTRIREPGGAWSTPARLTRPAEAADEPSMTSADDGALHLVWHDARVSLFNREVFHRAKTNGAAWDTTGAADTRLSNAGGASVRPSVAVRGGTVAVLWKDARDGNNEIYARLRVEAATSAPQIAASRSAPVLRAFPNPAPGGIVRFASAGGARGIDARSGAILLRDVRGRLVRRLAAGGGDVEWDGRDANGSRVPAGVYFAASEPSGARAAVVVLR